MLKININSIKFKIYFLFIISIFIVFSVSIFLTVYYMSVYSQKFLRERLKSQLMKATMKFSSDRRFMLEKANDIVAHNFRTSFVKKIFPSKEISSVILIRLKNGRIIYFKKLRYKYERDASITDYARFYKIISTRNSHIYTGFGRDKSDKLIDLRIIYWLIHKKSGFIIVLNNHITSGFLRNIHLKNHMIANIGVYYGDTRTAVSTLEKGKYLGIGQKATKKQMMVLKNGKSIYTSVAAKGIPFYIYNKPIKNYDGKIIGILGAGIKKYRWFWYVSKLFIPIFFLIGLSIFGILIFILVNKKFAGPFYDLLDSIKKIDPNDPRKLDLDGKYQNKESEFFELAKVVTVLNDKIIEKQEENNLIVSNINYFSKIISPSDDLSQVILKLMNLIVERIGYSYAWFGVLDDDGKNIKIINAYNNDFNYTKNLILKYDDSQYSQNLTAKAIKAESYAVINDVEADDTIPLYKDRLLKYGFLSVGVFPMIVYGNVIGVIGVYSSKRDAFDSVKAGAIFNLTNYAAHVLTYLKNLKRSLILSETAEQILFSFVTTEYETGMVKVDGGEFLDNLENNLKTDFIEFIVYDKIKSEVVEAKFSKGWNYNIGISSIAPSPTMFVRKRVAENRLDAYDYQEDEFATEIFKNMGVRDIMIYAFEGTKGRRYLAVTGAVKRKIVFYNEDLEFFRDGMNLFAMHFEINLLFEKLD